MSSLAPQPRFRIVDADGIALEGGKVYTYAAGTSTPKDSYTDSTLGSANTNPVILDVRGEADIWLSGAYKIIVTDSLDVLLPDHTIDNVRDLTLDATFTNPTLAGTPVVTASAVTWSGNPTHSGNHTWSGTQNFNGNVVIGNASTDTLTVAPNAVTWSNNPTHSGNHTWSGTQTYSAATTFNSTLTTISTGFALNGSTSGGFRISNTGVPYATSAHNNAGAVTGTTNQYYCSGTYAPLPIADTNVASVTVGVGQWIRVGNVVHVVATVAIDPTAADTLTIARIPLPIASAVSATTECSGVGTSNATGTDAALPSTGWITGNAVNDEAFLSFMTGTTVTSLQWYLTFSYEIKS